MDSKYSYETVCEESEDEWLALSRYYLREKMKSKSRFYYYILIVSILYGFQYYINNKITPVGDQTAFLDYAKEFHYNYLEFGINRYLTWSSRLLIESATLFFSVHDKLFILASIIASFFLLLPSKKLTPNLPWLPGFLIFIFLPASEFLSAGSIPTYINYVFPASFLLFSLYYRYSDKWWVQCFTFLSFVFAVMNEQLAVYAFLWIIFELIRDWNVIAYRYRNILFSFVSLTGIFSAKLSPGNTVRFEQNVASWFPNYVHLNPLQKLGLGILETGDGIFSISFAFVFVFLIVLIVLSALKKNFTSLILSSFTLLAIFSQKLEWRNILFTLSSVSKIARESGTFDYNVVYFGAVIYNIVLFMMLMYSVWTLTKNSDRLWIVYIFGIGLIGRLLISFSPTLYASSTRTYLPIMLSLFIITCYFLNDIYLYFKAELVLLFFFVCSRGIFCTNYSIIKVVYTFKD